jgi:aldose 1-epimerase
MGEATMTTELFVTNLGDSPMPAGVGFHPYFMRRLWAAADDVRVAVRTSGRYPGAGMIGGGRPTADSVTTALGAGGPLGGLELDDVFAGFDGRATIEWPSSGVSLAFECSPELGHAVVYAPAREDAGGGGRGSLSWFCIEPVSMVNDGFNRLAAGDGATGVRTLVPGERLEARWAMRIEGGA